MRCGERGAKEARQWIQAWLLRLPESWRPRPIQVVLEAMIGALELVRVCVIGRGGVGLIEGGSDSCPCPHPGHPPYTVLG